MACSFRARSEADGRVLPNRREAEVERATVGRGAERFQAWTAAGEAQGEVFSRIDNIGLFEAEYPRPA